jgi:hypothetical protein
MSRVCRHLGCLAMLSILLVAVCSSQTGGASLTGTVLDENGAVISGAQVVLKSQSTGEVRRTATSFDGRFVFVGIAPGRYDLDVEVAGFAVKRTAGINVGAGESSTVNVVMATGVIRGTPVTFTDPVWNTWVEPYSAIPAFRAATPQVNRDYSLIVNLSAILYSESEPGVYSTKASSTFSSWLKKNSSLNSADLDILVLPDRRYFAPQLPNEAMKALHVDLKKIRDIQEKGFILPVSPFETLRANQGNADFSFGIQSFRVRTKSLSGPATIALSIWANGTPIDEVSVSLCIVANVGDPCHPIPSNTGGLQGADLSGVGPYPDAALHIIDRQSDIVGVYRCNMCGWPEHDYRAWQIGESAQWFADQAKEILTLMTQSPDPDSKVTITQIFGQAGDDLYNTIFHSHDQDPDLGTAKKGFADFISSAQSSQQNGKRAPTLFVRLIPTKPDLVLVPVGLMRVPLDDHSKQFVGYNVEVQSPLESQDYSKPVGCISKWVLFVPPDKPTVPSLTDVYQARTQFADWITRFKDACPECVIDIESKFQSWLDGSDKPVGDGLVLLSHHSANSVFFYRDGSPAVHSASVSRTFNTPSFVLIDGCGSSMPGASEFIRKFNELGVSSVIATSTEVEPVMAGKFLDTFMNLLATHAKEDTYTVSRARLDTVRILSALKDEAGEAYGPRALAFVLAGNGALKACLPKGKNKSAPTRKNKPTPAAVTK